MKIGESIKMTKYEASIFTEVFKGDDTFRIDYNLTENSVVFDVGGYLGNWSEKIIEKYNCFVYIFEPVEEYYHIINEKFKDNKKVKIYNFGFSDESNLANMSKLGEGSSQYLSSDQIENVDMTTLSSFFTNNDVPRIDLLKLNIEGDEYKVLNDIITNKLLPYIDDIQIQWHDFKLEWEEQKKSIIKELKKLFILTYSFDGVWENWQNTSLFKEKNYIDILKKNQKMFKVLYRDDVYLQKEIENLKRQLQELKEHTNTIQNECNQQLSLKNTEIDEIKNECNKKITILRTEIEDAINEKNKIEAVANTKISKLEEKIESLKQI